MTPVKKEREAKWQLQQAFCSLKHLTHARERNLLLRHPPNTREIFYWCFMCRAPHEGWGMHDVKLAR